MQINCEKFVYLQIFLYLCTRKMINLLSRIWKSSSARNVGKLLSANVFAQLLGILVYPILTRMYAPEDFGLFNLFISIGGIIALLATGEYQSAILLPQREDEAATVARLACRVLGGWLVVVALTIPFSNDIADLFEAPELASVYWMLVPYVFGIGAWAIYNAWLTRNRAFGGISTYQLHQSLLGSITKLLFGWMKWLRTGLVLSSVLAPLLALLTEIFRSRNTFLTIWQSCPMSFRKVANKYRRFPLYSMPRSLLNTLSSNLPSLVLTPFFGMNQLGFFAMATTLAFRPVNMITASIHQVLFERVAQKVRDGQSVLKWLSRQWLMLAAVVVPCMILLAVFLPWFVRILLGEGWDETAQLILYMLPWVTCVFLVAPLAFISEVFGKQKLFLIIETIYLALRLLAMGAGIWMSSFKCAIILMSAVGTIILLTQLICYIVILYRYDSKRV